VLVQDNEEQEKAGSTGHDLYSLQTVNSAATGVASIPQLIEVISQGAMIGEWLGGWHASQREEGCTARVTTALFLKHAMAPMGGSGRRGNCCISQVSLTFSYTQLVATRPYSDTQEYKSYTDEPHAYGSKLK
jgi:hypothetical protein